MKLEKLKEPLDIKDIDFRVQSINRGGYATILAYKDARVDMNVLDNVVGAGFWKREHFDNNTRCRVSVYNKEISEWVSKEDVGTPSKTEGEKGLASDSFKRACFNWGIGRELYDFPIISVKLSKNEWELKNNYPKATYDLKIKDWIWVKSINEEGVIYLECSYNGVNRYKSTTKTSPKKDAPKKQEIKEVKKQSLTDDEFKKLNLKTNYQHIDAYLKIRTVTPEQRKALEELKKLL